MEPGGHIKLASPGAKAGGNLRELDGRCDGCGGGPAGDALEVDDLGQNMGLGRLAESSLPSTKPSSAGSGLGQSKMR